MVTNLCIVLLVLDKSEGIQIFVPTLNCCYNSVLRPRPFIKESIFEKFLDKNVSDIV